MKRRFADLPALKAFLENCKLIDSRVDYDGSGNKWGEQVYKDAAGTLWELQTLHGKPCHEVPYDPDKPRVWSMLQVTRTEERVVQISYEATPVPPDGVACIHPGCLSHVSHPCESCGRIAGKPTSRVQ